MLSGSGGVGCRASQRSKQNVPLLQDNAYHTAPRMVTCPELQEYIQLVRDKVEAELGHVADQAGLLSAAEQWRQWRASNGQPALVPDAWSSARWPTLAAWRWLVELPGREEGLSA